MVLASSRGAFAALALSCGAAWLVGSGGCSKEFQTESSGGSAGSAAGGATGGSGTGGNDVGGSGGAGHGATGGSGGQPPDCAHPLCDLGSKLDELCHACVADVCAEDAYCCNNAWDSKCLAEVYWICDIGCGDGGAATCVQQYALATGYVGCGGTPGKCSFVIDNTAKSCAQVCADYGGTCLAAAHSDGGCATVASAQCADIGNQTLMCECSQGCTGGPPCAPPLVCTNGGCQAG